uniref:Uncharacterized protein n=1 Tax=Romanomermis culicivorax TaxID=13658 RepID=A0A915J209_ROMCU
MEIVQNENQIN